MCWKRMHNSGHFGSHATTQLNKWRHPRRKHVHELAPSVFGAHAVKLGHTIHCHAHHAPIHANTYTTIQPRAHTVKNSHTREPIHPIIDVHTRKQRRVGRARLPVCARFAADDSGIARGMSACAYGILMCVGGMDVCA